MLPGAIDFDAAVALGAPRRASPTSPDDLVMIGIGGTPSRAYVCKANGEARTLLFAKSFFERKASP
jgi:hypothetical protein